MSLQIWLPLIKDARNQGLSNILITPSLTYTDGKIGKAATGSLRIEDGNDLNKIRNFLNSGGDFSIAFWLKVTNATSGDIISYGNSTGTGTRLHIAVNSNVLRFGFRADDYDGATLTLNKWYHIVCSYSNSKKYMYIDGSLYGSKASGVLNIPQTYILFDLSKSNLNDFRLYDHCLSPMEVKELAKGLVLHYPLNRGGWGQENLAHNTYNLSPFTTSQVEFKAYDVGLLDVSSGETVTVSFDLDMTVATAASSGYLLVYNTNHKGPHQITSQNALADRPLVVGQDIHERLSITTTINNRSDATRSTDAIEFYSNYDTENEIFISNIKIERGSVVTPWCPNSSDALATTLGLNSTTEYDCSGYCNNGTRTGVTYSSDTPKYSVSTVFDANTPSTIIVPNANYAIQGSQAMTWSIWAYDDDWTTYSGRIYSCTEGGGVNIESANSGANLNWAANMYTAADQSTYAYQGYCSLAVSTLTAGWHMFTWVYTTSGTKVYVDGVQKATHDIASYGLHFHTSAPLVLGGEASSTGAASPYLTGKLSDFRIYATALSADDVKSLYQNSAYIDSSGNVYGAVHEEV